jgi:hypothetical protein
MMQVREFMVPRICAFCSGIEAKLSNRIEPYGDWVQTINDLSPPCLTSQIDRIVPDRPKAFAHPVFRTNCVWNVMTFDAGTRETHKLGYEQKCLFREKIVEVARQKKDDVIVAFHVTEGEQWPNVEGFELGWHCHVFLMSKEVMMMKRPQSKRTFRLRWCDFVILSSTFKILMKLCEAKRRNIVVNMSKFCELPFPLDRVYSELAGDPILHRWSRASICLQMLVLQTGCLPVDLMELTENPYFHLINLWDAMYRFLLRWDYEKTEYHKRALTGDLLIHPKWLAVGEWEGKYYRAWSPASEEDFSTGVNRVE